MNNRDKIAREFAEAINSDKIFRIILFGSVARGEQKEGSDVDVCYEGIPKGFFAVCGLKRDLEELFGCSVDVVRLREKMDTFFKGRILKEVIYV